MSIVKADQVRRDLFRTYGAEISALLGEAADDSAAAPQWARRFRVSYARQHLLRQRCLQSAPAAAEAEEDAEEAKIKAEKEEKIKAEAKAKAEAEAKEEEGWRTVYDPPFPALRRVMRRMQDKSLKTLLCEALEEPQCAHGDEYAAQRMAVLLRMEEHNGRERIKRMARESEMTWTLPNVD